MMDSANGFQEEFFRKHNYFEVTALLLKNGQTVDMSLYGYCMRPFIRNGDSVLIRPIKPAQLRCGDIAVYRLGNRFKIHRFLGMQNILGKDHLITKGDRCVNRDPPVLLSEFLGVITQVKKGGRVIDYETDRWKRINFMIGKTSPWISLIERPIFFLLRLPRRCAGKLYRSVLS